MTYKMMENSGSLFKNKQPRNEKSPQWTGKALIDGKMRFFDAWEKTDKNGNTFFSCSFKEMDKVKQEISRTVKQTDGDMNDDIPW